MRMGEERLDQILGIGRHCRDRQPGAATIRVREGIEVLFQHRISAVRNSVLLQISWTQMCGYDLEIIRLPQRSSRNQPSGVILYRSALAVTRIDVFGSLPRGDREACPRRTLPCPRCAAET